MGNEERINELEEKLRAMDEINNRERLNLYKQQLAHQRNLPLDLVAMIEGKNETEIDDNIDKLQRILKGQTFNKLEKPLTEIEKLEEELKRMTAAGVRLEQRIALEWKIQQMKKDKS